MTPTEAVAKLMAAYRQDQSQETVALYAKEMADIDPVLLGQTISSIIESNKFFPAIAEIRERAAGIAGLLPPSGPEAVALLRTADVSRPVYRRDGSLAYVEREWDWSHIHDPVTLDAVRDALAKVGEPVDSEGREIFGWNTGFQKTYEKVAAEITHNLLSDLSKALPPKDHRRLTD